jgi:hypothetical protein
MPLTNTSISTRPADVFEKSFLAQGVNQPITIDLMVQKNRTINYASCMIANHALLIS